MSARRVRSVWPKANGTVRWTVPNDERPERSEGPRHPNIKRSKRIALYLQSPAATCQIAKAASERAQFIDYIRMQANSADPKVRSRAEDLLREMPA